MFDFSWFILIGLILKLKKKKKHFTLVTSDKWIVTIDSFNKQFIVGLRIHDLFNKLVVFVSTYVVKYSKIDTTQTKHTNTNCYSYKQLRVQDHSKP